MRQLFSLTVLLLIVLLTLSGGVAAQDDLHGLDIRTSSIVRDTSETDSRDAPGMYLCGGAEYDNSAGYGTTLGTAVRVGGSIWVLARGVGVVSGENESVEGDVAYIYAVKGWRVGLIAGPDANWVGEESTLVYITGSVGVLAGYIHDPARLGGIFGAKYKIGSDGFQDGWQVGLWLVYGL